MQFHPTPTPHTPQPPNFNPPHPTPTTQFHPTPTPYTPQPPYFTPPAHARTNTHYPDSHTPPERPQLLAAQAAPLWAHAAWLPQRILGHAALAAADPGEAGKEEKKEESFSRGICTLYTICG